MQILVIVPVLALVFLAWAPSPEKPSLRRAWFGAGLVAIAYLALRQLVPAEVLYGSNGSVIQSEAQVQHLRAIEDWEKSSVVILLGGSYTSYGIDGRTVEGLLADAGIKAAVLRFARPGSNHYDRLAMVKRFLEALTNEERQKLRDTNVIVLGEVCRSYDENPLRYMETVESFDRHRAYARIDSFPSALRTSLELKNDKGKVMWKLASSTLRHAFAVGTLSSMRIPLRHQPFNSFVGLPVGSHPPGFDFAKSWGEFSQVLREKGTFDQRAAGPVPPTAWTTMESELLRVIKPYADRGGFYLTPVFSPSEFVYQQDFAKAVSDRCIVLGPMPAERFTSLNEPKFWYDDTHVSMEGAKEETRWFGNELILNWQRLAGPFPDE